MGVEPGRGVHAPPWVRDRSSSLQQGKPGLPLLGRPLRRRCWVSPSGEFAIEALQCPSPRPAGIDILEAVGCVPAALNSACTCGVQSIDASPFECGGATPDPSACSSLHPFNAPGFSTIVRGGRRPADRPDDAPAHAPSSPARRAKHNSEEGPATLARASYFMPAQSGGRERVRGSLAGAPRRARLHPDIDKKPRQCSAPSWRVGSRSCHGVRMQARSISSSPSASRTSLCMSRSECSPCAEHAELTKANRAPDCAGSTRVCGAKSSTRV